MHGMRVASRVGTSVLALALTFTGHASAQQCIAQGVSRDLSSCEGLSATAPRRPGGGTGRGALPSAAPTVARDGGTAPVPDLASPRLRPGNQASRSRQYRLLRREREVLERLLGRMAPSAPRRADVLERLATTLGELMTQDTARARGLDQPIFEAREVGDAREVRRLMRLRNQADARVVEEREAAIRTYAALVGSFPDHPRLDAALYTVALLLEDWFDARSGRCEQALNRLDAVRFPIASELRGSPTYTPDGAARPGPPELTDGAQG